MIELSRHIEILLLENDCVVVPELGGFIAYHQPAHFEEDEGVFLPPTRMVGFNPQLTMNDGLMVQAYMQTYHTDFPDASRKLSKKVEELKETLYNEGMVEMPGIGTLHYTMRGNYEFHPSDNGVLSPSLYALDSFLMSPLVNRHVEGTIVQKEKTVLTSPEKRKDFSLNTHWLNNAVAVAIAIILFFVLSVPVENTYIDKGNYASLGTDCLFEAIRSQSMATTLKVLMEDEPQKTKSTQVVPVVVKVEKVAQTKKVEEKSETIAPTKVVTEVEKVNVVTERKDVPIEHVQKEVVSKPVVAASEKNYHIIVASLATSSDAKRMLQEYKQQGYTGASIIEGKGRFRIAVNSYEDKSVAYAKLTELKKMETFKNAWMLTSK